MKILQEPWFTWIFCVLPFAVVLTCKYWLMRETWDKDCPSKWGGGCELLFCWFHSTLGRYILRKRIWCYLTANFKRIGIHYDSQ